MFAIDPAPFFIMFFEKALAMLIIILKTHKKNISQGKLSRLSKTGHAYALDYTIGRLVFTPKVYNPDGLTIVINGFCVGSDGTQLTEAIKAPTKGKGAAQVVVVRRAYYNPKHKFLMDQNLSIACKGFVEGVI